MSEYYKPFIKYWCPKCKRYHFKNTIIFKEPVFGFRRMPFCKLNPEVELVMSWSD